MPTDSAVAGLDQYVSTVPGFPYDPSLEIGAVKGVQGIKPTDVVIDPTNLTDKEKKMLDDLLAASKPKPKLTEKEILENRIKLLEDKISNLESRILTLELGQFYTEYKKTWPESWVDPHIRFIESNYP